jgi:hypothetical protein
MVGSNDDKDRLINMLVSDIDTSRNNNLGVVGILGMGGVVCVSKDFDVVRVTKSLLESVVRKTTYAASKIWESDNLDILQVELKKNLREK